MKLFTALAAVAAVSSSKITVFAQLPDGAHDPRAAQPRPNICDDKCDVQFMVFYDQCVGQANCVQDARQLTCQGDFGCSMDCGYTAPGCVNPVEKAVASASSISCTGVETSTATVIMTVPRMSLDGGLVAAKVNTVKGDELMADAIVNGEDTTSPLLTTTLGGSTPSLLESSVKTAAPVPSVTFTFTTNGSTKSQVLTGFGNESVTFSASATTSEETSAVTSISTVSDSNDTTLTSHGTHTPSFSQGVPTVTHGVAAGTQAPVLAIAAGLAAAVLF